MNKSNIQDIQIIINGMKALTEANNFYDDYIYNLESSGKDVQPIKKCVGEAIEEIKAGTKRFVIYGEPQSGKTAMMIALTDRILNLGHRIVIILLNDSNRLLKQNHERFEESGIRPTPEKAMTIYENGEKIDDLKYILFCKKNARNLENLISMVKGKQLVVIDDEADYATPNGKINKDDRTKINQLVVKLVGEHNYYIGVTATPARLDLNNTLDTDNERWLQFKPHKDYIGKNQFFLEDGHYERIWVSANEERDLERAAIAFMCNVAVINSLNVQNNRAEQNYCFLIHTSFRRSDHKTDKTIIDKLQKSICVRGSLRQTRYYKAFTAHKNGHPILRQLPEDLILNYIDKYIASHRVILVNSDNVEDRDTTVPPAKFTFYVGGNLISRGVTFDNLLGMYFTRNTKTLFQQDTFIQRARMFGARRAYLNFFQLWIPEELFKDWQRSFIYNYISLETLTETGYAPIWTTGGRIVPTSPNSIDKKNIFSTKKERYSHKFDFLPYKEALSTILDNSKLSDYQKLTELEKLLPIKQDMKIIFKMIELLSMGRSSNVEFLGIRPVDKTTDYHDQLFRPKGVLGGDDIKKLRKDHAILFITNTFEEARMLYYYGAHKIRFFQKRGE